MQQHVHNDVQHVQQHVHNDVHVQQHVHVWNSDDIVHELHTSYLICMPR